MSWITFQLLSLFLNSVNGVLDKRLVRDHEANPVVYLASFAFVGLPVAIVGLIVIPWPGYEAAGIGLVTGLVFTGMVLLYYQALSLDDVSRLIPVLRLSGLLSLLFFAVFLGDHLSISQYIAVVCVLTGTFALSWKKKREKTGNYFGKGVFFMVIVAFLTAINSLLGAHLDLAYSPLVLLVWSQTGKVIGFLFVLMFRSQRKALSHSLAISSRYFQVCVIGEQTLRLITGLLSSFAIRETGSAAIVAVIDGFRPFVVLLLAVVFLQERFERQEVVSKLAGIGFMVIGAYFLVLPQ